MRRRTTKCIACNALAIGQMFGRVKQPAIVPQASGSAVETVYKSIPSTGAAEARVSRSEVRRLDGVAARTAAIHATHGGRERK